MLKRPEQILKVLCLLLAAALGFEVARVAARGKPLKSLTIPALPTFAAATPTDSTNASTGQKTKGTNSAAATNGSSSAKPGTNQTTAKTDSKDTNKLPETAKAETNGTKVVEADGTNTAKVKAEAAGTNVVASAAATSDKTNTANGTNKSDIVHDKTGTNTLASGSTTNRTNFLDMKEGAVAGTNSPVAQKTSAKGTGPGGRPEGKKGPDVPPAMKARIDRITQSEILAPVMRPMPMALLGIGGDEALIRSPEGQTGMVKEGKELGSIKLLKIGTNRVLIEEKGEKKELTIFSGFGGESLMPKEEKKAEDAKKDAKLEPKKTEEKDKKPNEPTKKSA